MDHLEDRFTAFTFHSPDKARPNGTGTSKSNNLAPKSPKYALLGIQTLGKSIEVRLANTVYSPS